MKFAFLSALALAALIPASILAADTDKTETDALNRQGFKMFQSLCSSNKTGNVFISPFSIDGAFGMAYSGAKGGTASQIRTALGLPDGPDACGKYFAAVTKNYAAVQNAKIYVSNSVWVDHRQEILPSFLEIIKNYYGGAFYEEDFANGAAVAKKINTYVEDRTNKMIKDLLSADVITPKTSMVLLNTLYFEADWDHPFNKSSTMDQPFTAFGGAKKDVKMMFQKSQLDYFADRAANVHGVVMPYKDPRFALIAIMPIQPGEDQGQAALNSIIASLDSKLAVWLVNFEPGETQLWLPKTKLGFKTDLTSLLKSLGMTDAFSDKADFSGIDGKRSLFISSVIHQTALEMDEKSTKAAAATGLVMSRMSLPRPQKLNSFRADRPFLALIRDMETGLILFAGRINDPTAK